MAVNDVVSQRFSPPSLEALQVQPPHFGKITAHAAPGTPTVWWDTFEVATLADANDADLHLDVIEDAAAGVIDTFTGETVLRISSSGATALDAAGGTSREFVGTVVAIYKRTPLGDAPGSGADYLLVKSGGVFFEDVAAQFVVIQA